MSLRKRASAIVVANNSLLCFFAIDPTSGKEYYFLPGGAIEGNEIPEQAAVRETLEETGFHITIAPQQALIREYDFTWDGTYYRSHTHFFRGELTEDFRQPGKVQDVDYNKGAVWLPLSKVHEKFSYTTEILDAILQLIK